MSLFERTDDANRLLELRSLEIAERTARVQADLAKGGHLPYTVLTTEGVARAEARLAALEDRLQELRVDKNESFELSGDGWHDNPGWRQIVSMEEAMLETKVRLLTMLNDAIIVDPSLTPETISIGSRVALRQEGAADSDRYLIVGLEEMAQDEGEDGDETPITYESPLAQVLLGRSAGDRIELAFTGRPVPYLIESVA